MFKQMIGLLTISILIIMGMPYAQHSIQFLLNAHEWFSAHLTQVFSGGEAGNLAKDLIALLIIPLVVGLIPAAAYWLAKRKWFPYFMQFVWVSWFVQTAALVMVFKAGS